MKEVFFEDKKKHRFNRYFDHRMNLIAEIFCSWNRFFIVTIETNDNRMCLRIFSNSKRIQSIDWRRKIWDGRIFYRSNASTCNCKARGRLHPKTRTGKITSFVFSTGLGIGSVFDTLGFSTNGSCFSIDDGKPLRLISRRIFTKKKTPVVMKIFFSSDLIFHFDFQ